METLLSLYFKTIKELEFQKDLIVWKLVCVSPMSAVFSTFQKDLIVWKPAVTNNL